MSQVIKSWWDPKTVAEYKRRANCVSGYYSTYHQDGKAVPGRAAYLETRRWKRTWPTWGVCTSPTAPCSPTAAGCTAVYARCAAVYGCCGAVYGCCAAVYGCCGAVYGCCVAVDAGRVAGCMHVAMQCMHPAPRCATPLFLMHAVCPFLAVFSAGKTAFHGCSTDMPAPPPQTWGACWRIPLPGCSQ
eukprot:1221943-Rhodomonas_salina.1